MIEYVKGPCAWSRIAPTRLRQLACRDHATWQHYSTSRLLDGSDPRIVHRSEYSKLQDGFDIQVELLPDNLTERWQRSGLRFATLAEIGDMNFRQVLECSLGMIRQVDPILGTVAGMCRSLHVLKTSGWGFDCSSSDPLLPFSIFVSCPMAREVNRVERLAESIVHEALHLQLSLVETIEPLIIQCRGAKGLYSPWKDEWRPVQGVLHGVYVFGNLRYFWKCIGAQFSTCSSFTEARVKDIDDQLASQKGLVEHPALTETGRSIVMSLLYAP